MVPVPPLHRGSVLASDSDNAGGSTRVMDWVLVHPLASLAVTVCVPGATGLNVCGEVKVANAPPSSDSWNAPVPPENVAVMVPVPPLHDGSALVSVRVMADGWVRVLVWLVVHRLASFTTTVCAPAARPLNVSGDVADANEPASIW